MANHANYLMAASYSLQQLVVTKQLMTQRYF